MQLAPTDMTFGDRKFNFFRSLPPDMCFHISNSNPASMSDVYEAARVYERYRRTSGNNHNHSHGRTSDPRLRRPNQPSSGGVSSSSMYPSVNDATSGAVPMDLDTFSHTAQNIDKMKMRCYNCNKLGHFSKDCRQPRKRRPMSAGLSKRPAQPMFHIADPDPLRPGRMYNSTPYPQTHFNYSFPRTDIQKRTPQSEVDRFLGSVKVEPTEPSLSMNAFALDMRSTPETSLPIYVATVSGRPSRPGKYIVVKEVDVIADTGARDNFIRSDVVQAINAEYFSINPPRDIAGAGRTVTYGFAKFTLKIGGVEEVISAYVLPKNSGFRYDLLLGRDFLARHNVVFNWDRNTLEIVSPKTRALITIQARPNPQSLPVQEVYCTNVDDDKGTSNDEDSSDNAPSELVLDNDNPKAEEPEKKQKISQKLKNMA
ncbi:hypothetical protein EV361DRAFT_980728, partial [Lentinula raphanica]